MQYLVKVPVGLRSFCLSFNAVHRDLQHRRPWGCAATAAWQAGRGRGQLSMAAEASRASTAFSLGNSETSHPPYLASSGPACSLLHRAAN